MGHELWSARFGADPRIIGRSVDLDEQLFANLGYLRYHQEKSGHKLDVSRVVDYILNRKMAKDSQWERYQVVEPDLLLGACDLRRASEVVAARAEKTRDETMDQLGAIARGLGGRRGT